MEWGILTQPPPAAAPTSGPGTLASARCATRGKQERKKTLPISPPVWLYLSPGLPSLDQDPAGDSVATLGVPAPSLGWMSLLSQTEGGVFQSTSSLLDAQLLKRHPQLGCPEGQARPPLGLQVPSSCICGPGMEPRALVLHQPISL